MSNDQMRTQMGSGAGFIAALDQSGGSTPKALGLYGIEESAWTTEEQMFDLVHAMRTRIITNPAFVATKNGSLRSRRSRAISRSERPSP